MTSDNRFEDESDIIIINNLMDIASRRFYLEDEFADLLKEAASRLLEYSLMMGGT